MPSFAIDGWRVWRLATMRKPDGAVPKHGTGQRCFALVLVFVAVRPRHFSPLPRVVRRPFMLRLFRSDSCGEVKYMILFDLGHVMGFTVGSTYILHHITVHSGPGLDDSRFRATRAFPASWAMTYSYGLL